MSKKKALFFICGQLFIFLMLGSLLLPSYVLPSCRIDNYIWATLNSTKSLLPEVKFRHGRYIVEFDYRPTEVKMSQDGKNVLLSDVDHEGKKYFFSAPNEDEVTLEWISLTGVKDSVTVSPIKRSEKLLFVGLILTVIVAIVYMVEKRSTRS